MVRLDPEIPEPERAEQEIDETLHILRDGTPIKDETGNPMLDEAIAEARGAKVMTAIRDAAVKAQAASIRNDLVVSVLDSLKPIDPLDTWPETRDSDAQIVARYVATLADELAAYIVTGEIPAMPTATDETGTIDGE